jgi:hypothetical protein
MEEGSSVDINNDGQPFVSNETQLYNVIPNTIDLSVPGFVCINGATREGKSHFINYVLFKYRNYFAYGVAFSQTAFDTDNLSMIPPEFKHPGWNEEKAIAFIQLRMAQYAAGVILSDPGNIAFMVIDDNVSDKNMWKSPALTQIVTQTKHLGVFIIISTQYAVKIPAILREQAFQVVIFHTKGIRSKKALVESYGNEYEDINHFERDLLSRLPQRSYNFAIFDNTHSEYGWRIFKCPGPETIPIWQFNYGRGEAGVTIFRGQHPNDPRFRADPTIAGRNIPQQQQQRKGGHQHQ